MRNVFVPAIALALILGIGGAAAATAQDPNSSLSIDPRFPTAADRIKVTVSTVADCDIFSIEPPRFEDHRIVLNLSNAHICDPPFVRPVSADVFVGPLAAGTYTIDAFIDGQPAAQKTIDVAPASTVLTLFDQFEISVEWATKDGRLKGTGHAVPLTSKSGYFWFFEGENPEILVKMLDGTQVNGHYWIFISSNSDLEYKVKVVFTNFEPPHRMEKVYVSPPGANKNFIDLTTF